MRPLLARSSVLISAALIHHNYYHPTSHLHCDSRPPARRMIPAFKTTFAVPLHCASCVEDVSGALREVDGVAGIEASLPTQTVTVTGTAAPSALVSAIQSTGRDAILRGSGTSNSAAVSILETHHPTSSASPVRGLARLVQVSPTQTLIDLTLRGLLPGRYRASVRERGDISRGAASTGPIWRGSDAGISTPSPTNRPTEDHEPTTPKGLLGEIIIGPDGAGSAFLAKEVRVWEVIGRGLVVAPEQGGEGEEKLEWEGKGEGRGKGEVVVGVVARSAGVWDNEKTVCSCSGKTVWEERGEQVARGML
ncbi:copper chaperone [Xylographa carneopallida]|nr:copper chaperone [Xylographa carneopallida]